MYSIHLFCAFAVIFVNLQESTGQSLCVPGPVINLTVSTSRGLSWVRPDDSCTIANYLVTVRKDGNPNLLYYVATTNLNLSTLEICERYEFSVIAVTTTHVQGLETILSTKTPPQGLDLTVDVLNATQSSQDVQLTWSMKTGVEHCVDSFRLVVWDEDTVTPTDIYVQDTSITLQNVVPCMKYEYEIRAIIGAEEEGNPLYKNFTATGIVSRPPTLSSINQGVTTVNITWNLQSYAENRCPITSIIADASPNFNVTFPVDDSSRRPPYAMTLTDLRPNTIYLCRIYIVNTAGVSSPLAIAVQTQPGQDAEIDDMEEPHHHEILQLHQHILPPIQ